MNRPKFIKLIEETLEEAFLYSDHSLDIARDNGQFHEAIDGCVPVYYYDIVELWADLGMPEPTDYDAGYVSPSDNIVKQMQIGIYVWAEEYANDNADDWETKWKREHPRGTAVSVCADCATLDEVTLDNDEEHFSKSPCDICGEVLAGGRYQGRQD